MNNMVATLREEHRKIAFLLDVFEREVELVAVASDADWGVLQGIAEYFYDYPDRCHHPKEDAIFRRLQERFPEEARSLDDLLAQHRHVRSRVQTFHEQIQSIFIEDVLPREKLISTARDFVDMQRQHMMKEEELFFPVAERLLAEEDWERIESQLYSGVDPIFEEFTNREFEAVRSRLLAWSLSNPAG